VKCVVSQNQSQLAFLTKAKFAIFGVIFENDVKNLSDVKTFFFKYLTYNDYTHNYSYTNPLFTANNPLRFGKGSTPNMAA
jgi:hypothetical protein